MAWPMLTPTSTADDIGITSSALSAITSRLDAEVRALAGGGLGWPMTGLGWLAWLGCRRCR